MAYTKAVRAAALPWNQRRERRAAASTSELDRPAACFNLPLEPSSWLAAWGILSHKHLIKHPLRPSSDGVDEKRRVDGTLADKVILRL